MGHNCNITLGSLFLQYKWQKMCLEKVERPISH